MNIYIRLFHPIPRGNVLSHHKEISRWKAKENGDDSISFRRTKHAKIQVEFRGYKPAASPPSAGGLTRRAGGRGAYWSVLVSPGGLEVGEEAGVSQAGVWVLRDAPLVS